MLYSIVLNTGTSISMLFFISYSTVYLNLLFFRFVASLQYPPACYLFRACKTMANCGEDCEYSLTGGQPFLPQANCGDDCEYSLTGGQPFLTKVTYGDDLFCTYQYCTHVSSLSTYHAQVSTEQPSINVADFWGEW